MGQCGRGRQRVGERGGGWGERRGGTLDGKGGERFRVIGVRGMCWKGAIGGIGFQGSAAFRNGKKGRDEGTNSDPFRDIDN